MTDWKKSSFCSGGDCARVRRVGGRIEISDSRRPAEVAWFTPAHFAAFLQGVRAGDFDELTADVHTATAEP